MVRKQGAFFCAARRFIVPGLALVAFSLSALLYLSHNPEYYTVLNIFGVPLQPKKYPFIDLQYVLAGIECWNKGLDVYLIDPCDALGRLHAYSPIWLRLTFLPLQGWTMLLGVCLDCTFLLSLALLPPFKNGREFLILLLATLSPPVAYALERANVDVLIFIFVLVAVIIWLWRWPARLLAYVTIFLAGILKFYPIVLLGLAVRERVRTFVTVTAIGGFLLVLLIYQFHTELTAMLPNIPQGGYFSDMFGARNLPDGLSLTFRSYRGPGSTVIAQGAWITVLTWTVMIILSALQILAVVRWREFRRDFLTLATADQTLCVCGAAIICGCFFVGQSLAYRQIFLLFSFPALLSLWRQSSDRRIRHFSAQLCGLLLFLLWQGEMTWNVALSAELQFWTSPKEALLIHAASWFVREVVWWRVTSVFVGILVCFVVESQIGHQLQRRLISRTNSIEVH